MWSLLEMSQEVELSVCMFQCFLYSSNYKVQGGLQNSLDLTKEYSFIQLLLNTI